VPLSDFAVLAVLVDGAGVRHGIVKLGGLDEPAEPSEEPAEPKEADGCTDWTCDDDCGLVAPRLVDGVVTPGLDVPDEPGWLGVVSLVVGAGLVDVGGAGLDDVGGAGLDDVGGAGLVLDPPGFGLVLTGGELLTSWHFVAAGELALWLGVDAGAPEPDGNCEAPLVACCWPEPPPPWPD
jgi:hypothetical protein